MSTLIVTGSRDLTNREKFTPEELERFKNHVFTTLDKEHVENPITLLVQGEAPGADLLARQWARAKNIKLDGFPANWGMYGRSAGPRRNVEMLKPIRKPVLSGFRWVLALGLVDA